MLFENRQATPDEAATIVGHRRSMFSDMGHRDAARLDAMSIAFHSWLMEKMRSGEYLAWFAVTESGVVAAGAGLWLMDWPPHLIGRGARRGNIINVYTEPEYRRQGLARSLLLTMLDWSRTNGLDTIILHASAEGRPLYESLGFEPTNEMRLVRDQAG